MYEMQGPGAVAPDPSRRSGVVPVTSFLACRAEAQPTGKPASDPAGPRLATGFPVRLRCSDLTPNGSSVVGDVVHV